MENIALESFKTKTNNNSKSKEDESYAKTTEDNGCRPTTETVIRLIIYKIFIKKYRNL